MAVDLTVLGSAGSHTGPGKACSGYLLRCGGTQLLLDCGNGATANLQLFTTFDQLDAIVVTHRHVDHCVDLVGMFYALRFHADGPKHLPLYAAPQVMDLLTSLLSEDSAFAFRDAFRHTEINAGDQVDIGPFHIEFFHSIHPVPTVSTRITVEDRVIAYSSDSWGGEELIRAAKDADFFLCEATWQGEMDEWPEGIHLTAREAGRIATQARVKRLVLTHLLGSIDRETSLEQARETFDGDLALADDLQNWSLN